MQKHIFTIIFGLILSAGQSQAQVQNTFRFDPGWNWISFNLQPADLSLDSVFSSILDQIEQVKTQTRSAIRNGNSWWGDLTDMSAIAQGTMYKVRVNSACTLTVSGTAIPVSTPISLTAGWNWAAFYPSTLQPLSEALTSISAQAQQAKSQTQSAIHSNGKWVGDLTEMEPQKGYSILTDSPVSLIYPSNIPYGVIPDGLPARLAVGLTESPNATWMKDSGVQWDMRYHYFTKGWRDNWGWDPTNSGKWGLSWMTKCAEQGFIPVIQYYCMNDEPGGGESQFYEKTRNSVTMASYFDDFKVLMERSKEFDQPVLVLMEADGFAYMERQTGDNPDAYSAIADCGMPELSGLPNTAAGWGLAFLQIRKSVGASKVILGLHISGWTTGNDIGYFQAHVPLQPEVDKAYAFFSRLGLAANVTGETYEVLVGDPLDRDSGYFEVVQGQDKWWDPSDTAGILTKSFNRYAEWVRLWNVKSGKRWVLWQIPLGNSNHLNVPFDLSNPTEPRLGYKDNRPEYFFLNGLDHLRKFAEAGAISLLFGPGRGDQSHHTNDVYTDGQLFMKSRAGAFLNAGGLPIPRNGRD